MFQNISKAHPLFEKSQKPSQSTLLAAVLPFQDNSDSNPFASKNQHLQNQHKLNGNSNKKKGTHLSQSLNHGQLPKKNPLITSKVSQTDTIKEQILEEQQEGSSDNYRGQLIPPGSYNKSKRTNRNSPGNQSASSNELQRLKNSQNLPSEFYDIGGTVYKNYKYEKLKKLHRPEFAFLSKLPLDFVGKCFAQKQQIKVISPEDALNNLKMQHFIEGKDTIAGKDQKDIRANSAGKVVAANELDPMREIKRKLQESLIDRQKRVDFLEKSTKINSNLEKLDSSIRQQRNLINRNGNNSQFGQSDIHSAQNHSLSYNSQHGVAGEVNGNSTSNSVILLKNLNSSNISTASNQNTNNNSIQWISPLIRHDAMTRQPRAPPLAGSDYILKCELLQKIDNQQSSSNLHLKTTNNASIDQSITSPSQNQSQHTGDQMCLSVIYINKAMKGRGKKLHSLLQHDQNIKDSKKTMSAGKLARSLKYKSHNILIAEEYNRLIQLQRDEIARNNTKRIPTKLQSHQENIQINSKKDSSLARNDSTGVRMLLVQVFLRETTFFGLYVREDERIREKILGALTEHENGISFERYMEFYQIFAFSNTPQQVLIEFLCRYFLYSDTSILKAISLQQFLDELRVLITHPQLTDRDEVFEQWEIALQSNSEFNYNMNFLLRKKHLENIFKESIVNPNLILKLLFQ